MLDGKAGRNAAIVAAGPLGAALSSMVLTLVMSWNFVPGVLGALTILELAALFFVMTCTLGLDQAYVREYAAATDQSALFAAAVVVPVVTGVAAALVLTWVMPLLGVSVLSEAGSAGIGIAAGYGFAALVIRMLSVVLRMQGPPVVFSTLQVAQRGSTVLILAITLLITDYRGPITAMICYLLGAILSMVLHLIACRAEIRQALSEAINWRLFRSLLRYGIPVLFAASLYVVLSSSDRMALALFGSKAELGIYAVALSIAGAISIFTSIFSVIWAPMIYGNEERVRDSEVIRPYLETVTLLTLVSAGVVAAIAWFLPLIFPKAYTEVAYFVPACMALPLLYILSEAFGIGIGVSRRMGFATFASGISAGVALGVSSLLVPSHGAQGAATGVLVGAYCFLILRTEIAAMLWYRLPSRNMYMAVGIYFIGGIFSLFQGFRIGAMYPLIWVIYAVICILLYRQRVMAIIMMLRRMVR